MKQIRIHDRVRIKIVPKAKYSDYKKRCIHCGKPLDPGKLGIVFTKPAVGITLRFNLWIHFECFLAFIDEIETNLKKSKPTLEEMMPEIIASQI